MNGLSRRNFGFLTAAAAGAVTLAACGPSSTPGPSAPAGAPPKPSHPMNPVKQIDAGDLDVG